jgi:hypothetical protein
LKFLKKFPILTGMEERFEMETVAAMEQAKEKA